jgi:hypothetical protein
VVLHNDKYLIARAKYCIGLSIVHLTFSDMEPQSTSDGTLSPATTKLTKKGCLFTILAAVVVAALIALLLPKTAVDGQNASPDAGYLKGSLPISRPRK